MSYRVRSDGTTSENSTPYLYGYNFALNNTRIVQSIQLPNNANVIITSISLVPNWPPVFTVNPITLSSVNAGELFSSSLGPFATDLNGDPRAFGKVSGPAWLIVGGSGILSGTPANSDANTNTFVVSVRDATGLSNTATLYIYVNGAPVFTNDPFTLPSVIAGQNYSGTIATNASDPNPGDLLTFAKSSGPAWLTIANDGALSGTPLPTDAGTNTFAVIVTDPGGLSGTATLNILVTGTTPIVSTISLQAGTVFLNWSGGSAPYQVQATTNLANPDWQTVADSINGTSLSVEATNNATFYRIMGQ
jgi:hypothetical protein